MPLPPWRLLAYVRAIRWEREEGLPVHRLAHDERGSIVSGGLQSTRRSQTYSDYKRFVGDSRVVERD